MIYASDLDQTLIYSRKSFRLNGNDEPMIRLIEVLNGEEISFMSEKAITLLQDIAAKIMFVPVTTRTVEQYQRISIFQNDIVPQFAITSNGGNIVRNGEVDKEWHESVLNRMANECMAGQDVLDEFDRIRNDSWVKTGKMADNLFYYFIVERDQVPMVELNQFGEWLKQQGWSLSLQGRKVYMVPHVVSKRLAVEHIVQMQEARQLVASGDSLLDLCMLEAAHVAVAPAHGEIYNQYKAGTNSLEFIQFTKQQGILSSEEMLERVLKLVHEA